MAHGVLHQFGDDEFRVPDQIRRCPGSTPLRDELASHRAARGRGGVGRMSYVGRRNSICHEIGTSLPRGRKPGCALGAALVPVHSCTCPVPIGDHATIGNQVVILSAVGYAAKVYDDRPTGIRYPMPVRSNEGPTMTRTLTVRSAVDKQVAASIVTVLPGQRGRRTERLVAPRQEDCLTAALAAATSEGVTAVWTANHSAAVELGRLSGPHEYLLTDTEAAHFGLAPKAPRQLALSPVRCAVYEHVLCTGSPFAIYRWVDLLELARVWRALCLPRGIRSEWRRALRATGLLEKS